MDTILAPVQDEEALSQSSRGGGELCLSYIVFHSHIFFELPGRGISSNRTTGYNYSQAGSDNSSAAIEYSMVDSLVYTNVFTVGAKTPLRTKQAFRVTWLAEGVSTSLGFEYFWIHDNDPKLIIVKYDRVPEHTMYGVTAPSPESTSCRLILWTVMITYKMN